MAPLSIVTLNDVKSHFSPLAKARVIRFNSCSYHVLSIYGTISHGTKPILALSLAFSVSLVLNRHWHQNNYYDT